jgi:hypothetical protein
VKPAALVADAIKDVSRRGDIVLDAFAGSGTTAIAAQKAKRRARLIELDELYCDVICRRFFAFTGQEPIHAATGLTFSEMLLKGPGQERCLIPPAAMTAPSPPAYGRMRAAVLHAQACFIGIERCG